MSRYFSRIREYDPIHEEIHDPNTIHGCVGPGHVLHRRPALSRCIAVRRKELRYLQMG